MPTPQPVAPHRQETGAITIMVALMLLVLLTISAIGMSRNSFKEVVASGFMRQGAMARSVADSGAEWTIHWLEVDNSTKASGVSPLALVNLKTLLLADPTKAGVAKDLISQNDYTPGGTLLAGQTLPSPAGFTEGFTIGLTQMGKLPISDMSQGVGPGAFAPATGAVLLAAPDLWAVRCDAQVKQGAVTFIHAKEVWISTPVQ